MIYTDSGTLTVHTDEHTWTVPPRRALWMPDGLGATVHNRYPVAVRTLYFAVALGAMNSGARSIVLAGFARHLLLYVVRVCPLDVTDQGQRALLTVLIDQLRNLPDTPLGLPSPRDPTTRTAAELIRASPATAASAAARAVGMSHRTLQRRFVAETGMTLAAWHRRARILDSLEPLAAGASVTHASAHAGYSTPSAFVAAFTRELGQTPLGFMRRPQT